MNGSLFPILRRSTDSKATFLSPTQQSYKEDTPHAPRKLGCSCVTFHALSRTPLPITVNTLHFVLET